MSRAEFLAALAAVVGIGPHQHRFGPWVAHPTWSHRATVAGAYTRQPIIDARRECRCGWTEAQVVWRGEAEPTNEDWQPSGGRTAWDSMLVMLGEEQG